MIKIHGKDYMEVKDRVEIFLEKYKNWSIETQVENINFEKGCCLIKATIKDESGRVRATGYGMEEKLDKTSTVNLNAYVENCETSAVGRALGFLGIGINTAIASADEMKIKTEHNSTTVEEFKKEIDKAPLDMLGKIWFRYKQQFGEDSEEYKELNKYSGARKIELTNPDLKVEK